jgi:hypothetical protein
MCGTRNRRLPIDPIAEAVRMSKALHSTSLARASISARKTFWRPVRRRSS